MILSGNLALPLHDRDLASVRRSVLIGGQGQSAPLTTCVPLVLSFERFRIEQNRFNLAVEFLS